MMRLQHKIFFIFVGLLIVIQSFILWFNYRDLRQQERDHIEIRLQTARSAFEDRIAQRNYYLAAFAETAAKDFGLKQAFAEDTRSFLVALNNHRRRIAADIAIGVNADGVVVGELINAPAEEGGFKVRVGEEQGKSFRFPDWFDEPERGRYYPQGQQLYQVNFSLLKSGDLEIGRIGFGYGFGDRLASEFAGLTGLTTEFAINENDQWRLLASSLAPTGFEPRYSRLIERIMLGDQPEEVIATFYPMGTADGRPVVAALYGQRSDLLVDLQSRWYWLFLLAGATLAVSMLGAYGIAASISRPVRELVEQAREVASGNYAHPIQLISRDELGQLASEFNQMKQAIISREETISHQAYHDTLTGLPNRLRLLEAISRRVMTSRRFVLLRLGTWQIRDVNYTLGQETGDAVIVGMARRLGGICGNGELYNLGGSAFAVLLDVADARAIDTRLAEIERVIEAFFELDEISLRIQVQIGIAAYPEDDTEGGSLLERAGVALEHAQQEGRSSMKYERAMSRSIVDRLYLINGLAHAIDEQQLQLYFQPKLDLASSQISGVEVLLRWQHPEFGMVPPDKFITLAEQTGHIHRITRWVLEAALKQQARWRDDGINLCLAINLSPESLRYAEFCGEVNSLVSQYELLPEMITFEVTESVVVHDPEAAIDLLSRFTQSGYRLSVDDYGTGYSSLSQLKRLPVGEIKIDKSFVIALLQHEDDQTIVKSTIDMAHAMGLKVVAEGVEDEEALDWLRQQGCECAQGFFICRPKPADELREWLSRTPYFNRPASLVEVK